MKNKINAEQMELLKYCARNDINLLKDLNEKSIKDFSDEQYNQLRELIGSELAEKGFDENWAPNTYGNRLNDLHEVIGWFLFWPEQNN
ncbi:MAG: hypothetical protein LBN26_04170 [Christensenellaceae bacterium]|jgi:hypothetical protein|nr:hypothetical protein [Christensenellaceae bacterium]